MRDGYIRLGDPTTSGGSVVTAGSIFFVSDGKSVALEGDEALCPAHGGVFKIVGGDTGMVIDGRRAATELLSKLACGCGLIATSRSSFARVEEAATFRSSQARYARPPAAPRLERMSLTDPSSTFDGARRADPCGPLRRFSASDIRVIQSYNTIKQSVIEVPEGSVRSAKLQEWCRKAAAALNRAGRELESRSLCEHVSILNKVAVYLSIETVGAAKAFVSKSPIFDLVINSEPFSRLWDGHKVGLMLHELHHFTEENTQMRKGQIDSWKMMGPGSGYENNCFDFQARLGYPAFGYFDFSLEETNE